MWKMLLVTAVLALVLAATVPSMADVSLGDVSLESNPEIDETGSVTGNINVSSSGDSGSQCVAPLQFGNTGNAQEHAGFIQYASKIDDLKVEEGSLAFIQYASELDDLNVEGGSPMTFEPTSSSTCDQAVGQAAAAG